MKTKLFLLTFAAAGLGLAGCDRDDDGIRVDGALDDAFRTRYPDATRVEWERKNDYYVADFRRDGAEAEAWFDGQAVWYMTETDIRYADLPQAVRTAFERSEWGGWRVEDVDMLEHPDRETVYVIEAEQGSAECDLYFTPDGVLAKTLPEGSGTGGTPGTPGTGNGGTHEPSAILPAIKAFIAERYPQARIVDVDTERNSIEVDIVDGRTPREAVFSLAGEWLRTETDVRYADLPQAVRTAFEQGDYAAWRVDDVDMMEYPDRETVYIVEAEQGDTERDLWFTPDGVLAKTVPEDTGTPGPGDTPGNGGGNNGGDTQPSAVLPAIKTFIAERYPAARIVDVDTERSSIEVDIVDGRTPREVVFTLAGEWIRTETEVRQADVPPAVLAALSASQYGSWRVDDIDHYAAPAGEYWLFELESGNREVNLKIDAAGNIL